MTQTSGSQTSAESPEGLAKIWITGPSHSQCGECLIQWVQVQSRICFFKEFPCDADASGPGHGPHFENH